VRAWQRRVFNTAWSIGILPSLRTNTQAAFKEHIFSKNLHQIISKNTLFCIKFVKILPAECWGFCPDPQRHLAARNKVSNCQF